MKKIGIVYAISQIAGEHCKKQIEDAQIDTPFDIVMHECPATEYKLAADDLKKIAGLVLKSISDLQMRGARVIIIAANSVHRAFGIIDEYLRRFFPHVNLLSIVDVTVKECIRQKYKTVAIFGSNTTINSSIYQNMLRFVGIEILLLTQEEQNLLNSIIVSGESPFTISQDKKEGVIAIAHRLKALNCDAVILACTELPLIFNAYNLDIEIVDSSQVLAHAAVSAVNKLLSSKTIAKNFLSE